MNKSYQFPPIDLLEKRQIKEINSEEVLDEQQKNKNLIIKTLLDYKIPIQSIEATIGSTITLYEIVPAKGVRINHILKYENDIANSLEALCGRIIAPIPGTEIIGIEVPNRTPETVTIRSVIASEKFAEARRIMHLPMAIGATVSRDFFIQDLSRMPHLLIAGAPGQGKSILINSIILSLIYSLSPDDLKFILIDPKMVEFTAYNKICKQYLAKIKGSDITGYSGVITDFAQAKYALYSLCSEVDNRYDLLLKANCHSINDYNAKLREGKLSNENAHRHLPYLVLIIDEFADLILIDKEMKILIVRIAPKARAVGIHVIIATHRSSADVISGLIKMNFPDRAAFRVTSMTDSKIILDCPGANQLIGCGDMLFQTNGFVTRVQGAFTDTPDVENVCDWISNNAICTEQYYLPENALSNDVSTPEIDKRDPLFEEVARYIVTQHTASTSALQRRFSIGYNKAVKIMDQMEANGIVGPAQGPKPRKVLVDLCHIETLLGSERHNCDDAHCDEHSHKSQKANCIKRLCDRIRNFLNKKKRL